jgi:hypothetical protein
MLALVTTFFLLATSESLPLSNPEPLAQAPSAQRQQTSPTSSPLGHPGPSPQWLKVESLQPGDSIAILQPGRSLPTPCRFDDVTDDTLTCNVYPPGSSPRRTVYPIHSIQAIYVDEWDTSRGANPAPIVLGAALGGFLGGGISKEGSVRTIAVCVSLGSAIGATVGYIASSDYTPPRPHLHRRLLYQIP